MNRGPNGHWHFGVARLRTREARWGRVAEVLEPGAGPSHESPNSDLERLIEIQKDRRQVQSVSDIIDVYLASQYYARLGDATKTSYDHYLRRIDDRFGSQRIDFLEARGARSIIRQWRDDVLSKHPRTADATIAVFKLVLNFAVDEEYINRNPLLVLRKILTDTRRDIIWSDAQIALVLRYAPRHLARVLLLAIWTGQRQADLLSLKWTSYDGKYLRLQQQKVSTRFSGRRVKVLASKELRRVLAEIAEEQAARAEHIDPKRRVPRSEYILTTAKGVPWRTGFKCAWRKAVGDAGVAGVTFHDLRGTFITLAHRAGTPIREIAEASGHDERDCERVIRQHYLASGAESVISRLEMTKQFAPSDWTVLKTPGLASEYQTRLTGPRRSKGDARASPGNVVKASH